MQEQWALVLGASSGFGAAAARALAGAGYSIFGVHLDRRSTLPDAEAVVRDVEAAGATATFFNINAADEEKRRSVLDAMHAAAGAGSIRVLVHSLAFGTLRPYIGERAITESQMDMTLRVMAHTLVDWTQDMLRRNLLAEGGRIFAMTSSGSLRVIPSYGAVSAAKAALEAHCRQLAVELAPMRVTVNALRAGVTDTPALRKIPDHEMLLEGARRRNPSDRLTTPEDAARAVVALSSPDAGWITGNVINVDGGETIVE